MVDKGLVAVQEAPSEAPSEGEVQEVSSEAIERQKQLEAPWLREHIEKEATRRAQSQADKLVHQSRLRWEKEAEEQRAQLEEQKRLEEMDDEELGKFVRDNQRLAKTLDGRLNDHLQQVYQEALRAMLAASGKLGLDKSFSEEAYRALLAKPQTFAETLEAAVLHLAEQRAKGMAEKLAVTRAKALYEERLAKEREGEESPDVTPAMPAPASEDLRTVKGIVSATRSGKIKASEAAVRLRDLADGSVR